MNTLILPTITFLALSCAASAAIVGAQQSVINGDFSDGLAGWTTARGVVVENGVARLTNPGFLAQNMTVSGYPTGEYEFSYSFRIADPLASWRVNLGSRHFKAVMGEALELNGPKLFYLMYDGINSATPIVADTWYHLTVTGPGWNQPSTLTLSSALGTFTTQTDNNAMMPNGGRIEIYSFGGALHGDMEIDNISLWQVPEPSVAMLALMGGMSLIGVRRRTR